MRRSMLPSIMLRLALTLAIGLLTAAPASALGGSASGYGLDAGLASASGGVASSTYSANLLANPGFEQTSVNQATYWSAISGQWGSTAKLLPEAAQTGNYGVSIETTTGNKPWIQQTVPVEERATYEFSTWFKGMGVTGQAGFKFEFYTAEGKSAAESAAYFNTYRIRDGEWRYGSVTRTAPPGAAYVKFYLRLYGTGTIYFDNAALTMVKPKPQVAGHTDQEFYYSDAAEMEATLYVDPEDGNMSGKSVQLRLVDQTAGAAVYQWAPLPAAQTVPLTLDPRLMSVGRPYALEASLLDANGQTLGREEKTLYRWNRPTALPDGGIVTSGGQPFFPVIGYHAEPEDYPFLSAAGINTIQTKATEDWNRMKAQLDGAAANGLKALVYLYPGGTVKENIALVENYVTRFKNHPAVLAWYLIDEPSAKWIGAEELASSYHLIRSLDPVHPVYLVEADDQDFIESSKGTDVLAVDPYPLHRQPISLVGEHTRSAVERMEGKRPVWTVLQTFRTYAGQGLPQGMEPSRSEFRNMAYQAVLGGATGLGYYSLNDPGWTLRSTALWDDLKQFREELQWIASLVTEGEKTGGGHGEDAEWGLWRHQSDYYAIAVNLTKEDKSVAIPLGFTGFFYEPLFDGAPGQLAGHGNELDVLLTPEQAAVYKITPFGTVLEEASADLLEGKTLYAHPFWSQQIEATADLLARAADELGASAPDMRDAMNSVASAVRRLQTLREWILERPGEIPTQSKEVLLELTDGIGSRAGKVIGSLAALDLTSDTGYWLTGATGELNVLVRNNGEKALDNMRIRIDYPEAFALPPADYEVGTLAANGVSETRFEFVIPGAAAGSYPFRATVSFDYKGVTITAAKQAIRNIEPALVSGLLPVTLKASEGGNYPIEWKLTNRTGSVLTIAPAVSAGGGISISLPETVTLSAYGTATVQGSVYLPAHLASGSYPVSVSPLAGSVAYPEAVMEVKLDRNLQSNPGFEEGTGSSSVGWTFNNAVWDRTVSHSGQASARVNPTGTYNRVYPTDAASVPIVTGQRYRVGAWVKNGLTSGPLQLRIRQVSAAVATVRNEPGMTTPYGSDWTYVSSTFTASPGAVKAMLYFGVMADSVGGSVWLDDVVIEKIVE